MARVRSSPEEVRTPTPAWAAIPPMLATAVVVLTAAVTVPAAARIPTAVSGVVVTLAIGVVATQGRRHARLDEQRRRRGESEAADLRRRLAEQESQTVRLAETVLPAAMERLKQGDTVEEIMDGLAAGEPGDPGLHAAHLAMLRSVLEAVKAEEDLRDSARRAFVNIARRVQAIVHQKFQDLREMEDRHGRDSEVFADLLKLDHSTALIGRLADSIAVLGGSRPGRQWQKNVPLYSVLRGAISRITEYRRVDLHSVLEVAVVGPAVEPLIHALAELLDNATRYSPPHTRVHLTAVEVQSGVAVEIEDGGVGLSEEARARAERVFSEASAGLDLADLGETPRLGLSVVGRLAQGCGFQVALRPSAYAGVRAVLVIPHELLSTLPTPSTSIPGAGVVGAYSPSGPATIAPDRAAGDLTGHQSAHQIGQQIGQQIGHGSGRRSGTANGAVLPQRKRRAPATPASDGPVATATAPPVPAQQPGAPVPPGLWLAAFHDSATASPASPTAPTSSASDESSGSIRAAGDDPSTTEGEHA